MNSEQYDKTDRMKLRFPYKGSASKEDLWDLSTSQLNTVYKTLSRQARDVGEDSLVDNRTAEDRVLELKMEVVKYIFNVKVAEQDERKQRATKRVLKDKLMRVLETKQEEKYQGMSEEDVQKMIDEL